MRMIAPRLNHLLRILMHCTEPITVNELTKQLDVSRRTVFRELENVDALLKPYQLKIGTRVGGGIYLEGSSQHIEALRRDIEATGAVEPTSKHERRILLILELLTEIEQQKLFYYADRFKVSEATISHDLDTMEGWLSEYKLALVRKPGYGVSVIGTEFARRSAICACVLEAEKRKSSPIDIGYAYPPENIVGDLHELMATRFRNHLERFTEDSRATLARYMAVAVDRVRAHQVLDEMDLPESAAQLDVKFYTLAEHLISSLQLRYSCVFPASECTALALYLTACRVGSQPFVQTGEGGNEYRLMSLTYQIIEQFDPELAPLLKLDDQLVDGLVAHLQAALVRIENYVELSDPLLEQLERVYPEILEKCTRALKVLEPVSSHIASSEAGFLATHFGAAIMRLRQNGGRRASLRIGIVCAGGIGTSYLMASQMKEHFGTQAEIEISGVSDVEDWNRFDLLITSIPLLDMSVPAIQVQVVLTENDLAAVKQAIETCQTKQASRTARAGDEDLAAACSRIAQLANTARLLLTQFDVISIEPGCNFDQLARLAGYRFGGLPESGKLIYDDLIRREEISTQVVPSLGLILLHARTNGVETPMFSLIVPETNSFTHPQLGGLRCCVVLLAPEKSPRSSLELVGRVSSALVEDNSFLEAVLSGDKPLIYKLLEDNFRDYLAHNIRL